MKDSASCQGIEMSDILVRWVNCSVRTAPSAEAGAGTFSISIIMSEGDGAMVTMPCHGSGGSMKCDDLAEGLERLAAKVRNIVTPAARKQ
jgi:hypothetical protein